MIMSCALQPSGDATGIIVDSDIQLSGTIAQFGRTGLIAEVANVLVADFVHNAEAAMGPLHSSTSGVDGKITVQSPAAIAAVRKPISGFAVLVMSIRGLIRSWFRRES
jgi:hypothetical protein